MLGTLPVSNCSSSYRLPRPLQHRDLAPASTVADTPAPAAVGAAAAADAGGAAMAEVTAQSPAEELLSQIGEQATHVRSLKSKKAEADVVKTAIDNLLQLKAQYKTLTGSVGLSNLLPACSRNVLCFCRNCLLRMTGCHGLSSLSFLSGEDPPQVNATKKAPRKTAADKAKNQKFQLKTPKVGRP